MTESPSTGSGGQSSVLCPDGLPVYREILCPHNTVIQSSPFIDPYIPTETDTAHSPTASCPETASNLWVLTMQRPLDPAAYGKQAPETGSRLGLGNNLAR